MGESRLAAHHPRRRQELATLADHQGGRGRRPVGLVALRPTGLRAAARLHGQARPHRRRRRELADDRALAVTDAMLRPPSFKPGLCLPTRRLAVLVLLALVLAGGAAAATVPPPVVEAVHGRVVGWAKSGSDWFVVYVDRKGGDRCGLAGASWRMALVETTKLPVRVVADRRIGGAMCGNELAWVRAGRFSDGRRREVAFMLWTTPAIGASTYIYRVDGGRLRFLAKFGGDSVSLRRGT